MRAEPAGAWIVLSSSKVVIAGQEVLAGSDDPATEALPEDIASACSLDSEYTALLLHVSESEPLIKTGEADCSGSLVGAGVASGATGGTTSVASAAGTAG